MSAGAGYRYLLDSVAVGDAVRGPGRGLADYYPVEGCPPGRWLGSGLPALGRRELRAGGVVTEEQVARLLGQGRDPLTAEPLGRAYPKYRSPTERIADRVAELDPNLDDDARAAAVERIEAEEGKRRGRRAVAGFDLTFSVPKSVSVLWALADEHTRAQVIDAHHAAIADVIDLLEREVAATRMGARAPDGAVAQVPVAGVIAAAFDHYDSRAGDPQLHTHVVIANKAKTVLDGRWRALDGRPVHAAMVALSEHYNAVLADRLTTALGVVWTQRDRGADRNPAWEIAGIPNELLDVFSSRTADIDVAKEQLIADYVAAHGHQPSATTVLKLRQQATLATRPDKSLHSLSDLTDRWRTTAETHGHSPAAWLTHVLGGRSQQRLRAGDLSPATVEGIAATVVEVVGERRSTWRRWNLHAEATRQLMGVRFASLHDREAILASVVRAAERASVLLTPPELGAVPPELRREDGTSMLRPRHSEAFTSAELLAAEDRLLQLSRARNAPQVPAVTVAHHADGLGDDQVAAIAQVATSGRVVDVLVGPAGAGKTTTMRALRTAWEHLYGAGTVVGLAPSAAAAEVLGADLEVEAETPAKWLHELAGCRVALRAGQLVIVDEASLAGTHTLHRIATATADAAAKLLLLGDPAQLAAVDAGGAFRLLATDRDDVAELSDVRRFHHDWEKHASLQLRDGNAAVLDTYDQHCRLLDGDTDAMFDAAYTAWQADLASGKTSFLIAPTREHVTTLNARAHDDRVATGDVDPSIVIRLHDRTLAGVSDAIVTRRNHRQLTDASGRWVRNGDRWTISAILPDGALAVLGNGGSVQLPADYVAEHVELGYAVTAHRAQGATVDTAHAIVTPAMTRETLYVALTRGRASNRAYAITDSADLEAHQDDGDNVTGRRVLTGVLSRVGAERSAHETLRAEQDRWGGITQLAAEYDTIAATAQHDRWTNLIRGCGLTSDQANQVLASDAFGPLAAALRHADAHHLDLEELLPNLVDARELDNAHQVAAVLHHRITTATTRLAARHQRQPREMIAGLIPTAAGPMTPAMRTALDERQQLIEQRASGLVQTAIARHEPWIRHLGRVPQQWHGRDCWVRTATTVAAYRDRYDITTANPLGPDPVSDMQRADAGRVREALDRLRQIRALDARTASRRPVQRDSPGLGRSL
ncbi:MobF family relaxase [Euzebya sp.]|uniref:MobF family relaxase n=1 Tax=Euzebya sp. TaxID=1971409 RepID=UPI00351640D7